MWNHDTMNTLQLVLTAVGVSASLYVIWLVHKQIKLAETQVAKARESEEVVEVTAKELTTGDMNCLEASILNKGKVAARIRDVSLRCPLNEHGGLCSVQFQRNFFELEPGQREDVQLSPAFFSDEQRKQFASQLSTDIWISVVSDRGETARFEGERFGSTVLNWLNKNKRYTKKLLPQ